MNYNEIIQYVNKKYYDTIMNHKDGIINAFVEYYGEKYRNLITERFNTTTFTWFFYNYTFSFSNMHYLFPDIIITFLNFLKLQNKSTSLLWKLYKNKKYIEYHKIIGSTKGVDYNLIEKDLKKDDFAFCYLLNETEKVVVLPIFFITDKIFFHELDHAITFKGFYKEFNPRTNIMDYYGKTGLKSPGSNEKGAKDITIEELTHELIKDEIIDLYHKKNGPLFDELNYNKTSSYEKYNCLVNDFYNKYKDILIDTRLLDNKNYLFKYVDKEYFDMFSEELDDIFFKQIGFSKKNVKYLNKLLNKMEKEYKEEMTIEEYQELYPNKKIKILKKSR